MQGVLKTHLSLDVRDIEASATFYSKLFGVTPLKRRPGYAKFDLTAPLLNLALVEHTPTGRNVNHFGIQVDSSGAVEAAKRHLQAAGLLNLVEEGTVCCYAKQDKVWAADPDGNRWEFFVVLEDSDLMKSEDGACCVGAAPASCTTAETCVTTQVAISACGCSA
ncbi:MAG TPA: ArsI/CadI family heavy metal resistance metalloenzyme [Holophagaceae bacterium]|nr:ArsI/CadI family heavy metal resistance metalloenzyme [Holophagaceae bacterium]